MNDTVIKVENLSKRYILGSSDPYKTIRESIVNFFSESLKAGRKNGRLPGDGKSRELWALRDVSFEVKQGDIVGVIGRNGAGKSTLLKILTRITEPTAGRVTMKGRVGSLLEVGTGFHPELSGHENIYLYGAILGMDRYEITRKFDEIIAFAELEKFVDTPVKRYSSGMYMRLAFAVAAHLESEILLVDEVLAVGDTEFQKKCLGKMKEVTQNEGRTVLFVSHNMQAITKLCSSGLLLEHGKIVMTGSMDDVVQRYEVQAYDSFSSMTKTAGKIYSRDKTDNDEFAILDVSLNNERGEPVSNASTFENFSITVGFYSPREERNASVQIVFMTLDNTIILRCGMRPHSDIDMKFKKGINRATCFIKKLPLPAGTYLFSCGLTDRTFQWLTSLDAGLIEIKEKDIYNCGYPPLDKYSAAVADYSWVTDAN